MNITERKITVRSLSAQYTDHQENGVSGYGGLLDIRPPYQREFVYNESQRNAVIETVCKGFPLNIMYWAVRDNGEFEIIDGQQRTISICQYINNDYSIDNRYFHNLTQTEKELLLDYPLTVYICEGTESEKLEWFKTINIAGEELTEQELRNAVYHGPWLADAKAHFSRTGCAAYQLGSDYVSGSPIRQDYLETVIKWINDGQIEAYMAEHQHDANAAELWQYFQRVINWVQVVFPNYRREMKGISWGTLYNQYNTSIFNHIDLENRIKTLMMDDDVTKKKGIYEYLLSGDEKYLSIRSFTPQQKREAYERQDGICVVCNEHFELKDMEADHIDPWSKGGRTITENCQQLCIPCNRRKSGK